MATTPFARRNDPCPCGSGLKYKACHGKLGAAPPAAATPLAAVEDSVRNGMAAMHGNRLDEALAWFDGALARDPANAAAQHHKGYALCLKGDFPNGIEWLERGSALEPGNAEFANRLGFIRFLTNDLRGAVESLERAIALAPRMAEAHSNLSLALRDLGETDRALAEVRTALSIKPDLAPAHLNHAMVLLALGRFSEAWPEHAWRPDPRVNLRDPAASTLPHANALAPKADAWTTLHGEQGLGDTLFFMRFAPLAAARGARIRFWGDARLGPMLVRSGLALEFHAAERPPPQLDPARLVWVGDLPDLLATGNDSPLPAPLVPDEMRRQRWAARLAAAGPAPHIAITWRAGRPREGKASLAKEIPPSILGAAFRGVRGTLVCVQRDPRAGEMEAFEAAAGARVLDLSEGNADLEDMLALMSVVDEYVGVSNTNTHLRAGAGRAAHVLVPWPPEWRWTREGASSPWFPGFQVHRASVTGDWHEAMERLSAAMAGISHP